MIIRIVKMEFQEDKIESFKTLFENTREKIAASEGCRELYLLNDIYQPNIFMTYSIWDEESYLHAYRDSPLFNTTWETVKKWFSAKPQAWSLNKS